MTELEHIARDLAAILSSRGEDDWRQFIPMASEIGLRLDQEFDAIMGDETKHARPTDHKSGD